VSLLPFAGAVAAAGCFGVASVLEASAARRVALAPRLRPGLLLRLARQPRYAVGLGLDVAGMVLTAWALRSLPLFVVQAAVSASLVVTALLAAAVGDRPRRSTWVAVAAAGVGLVLLGGAAGEESPSPPSSVAPLLLAGVPVLLWTAALVHRRAREGAGVTLGLLAGVGFAGFAVAGRVADLDGAGGAASDPAAWALPAYLLAGLLLHGASLQRASVTAVTAAYVTVEVVVPAVVGIVLIGDEPRAGAWPAALLGFALVVAAVVALSRIEVAQVAVRRLDAAG
jgi:drug/metabolite transporter (DMT)-like permease